jgi:hypothetical protein
MDVPQKDIHDAVALAIEGGCVNDSTASTTALGSIDERHGWSDMGHSRARHPEQGIFCIPSNT